MTIKGIVRDVDGEIIQAGPQEFSSWPSGHSMVTLAVDIMPDRRTQRWSGRAVVNKTAQEIAAYDAAAPKLRAPELLIERMTAAEVNFFHATTNVNVRYLWFRLIGRNAPANVNSVAFKNGWVGVVKPAGIAAGIWADEATADARLAIITA